MSFIERKKINTNFEKYGKILFASLIKASMKGF
jgi:hypothetical protein